jgi:hypothetical protein
MSELKHSMFTSVLFEAAYHYRAITNTQVTPRLFYHIIAILSIPVTAHHPAPSLPPLLSSPLSGITRLTPCSIRRGGRQEACG